MDAVLPIAAHYGCDIVALTLDEAGIPATAEARLQIAERIVKEAARYGIGRERILEAYAHAVREHYRFFSYGDACFIEKARGA